MLAVRKNLLVPLAIAVHLATSQASLAQSSSAAGTDWNNSWGFQTATDISVALQRAQAIRNAEMAPAGPTNVVTNNNTYVTDSRQNYVDVSTSGDVTTDLQLGDRIGKNTNAVGSMNTGSTEINVNGSSNIITAENSASNTGCIDGSALDSLINDPAFMHAAALGSSTNPSGSNIAVEIGSMFAPAPNCVK